MSKSKRVVNSWNSPPKLFLKCMAVALFDEGLRGDALYKEFVALVPAWRKFFDNPISDNAVYQRADKARRYPSEAPENHPAMSVMFPRAKRDVAKRKRWTNAELRAAFDKPARARASKKPDHAGARA